MTYVRLADVGLLGYLSCMAINNLRGLLRNLSGPPLGDLCPLPKLPVLQELGLPRCSNFFFLMLHRSLGLRKLTEKTEGLCCVESDERDQALAFGSGLQLKHASSWLHRGHGNGRTCILST
jgi:hypothetical protein